MSVAEWSGAALRWEQRLSALKVRLGSVFGRPEVRASAGTFIDGLLSGVGCKTGWLIAEQAGLGRPYRMQSLLGRSSWNAEKLRDLVRAEVIASLGDPRGVLVVDETGFLKKGTHFGRRRSAVFRDGRADRELPGWRLSRLRDPAWSGADRSA